MYFLIYPKFNLYVLDSYVSFLLIFSFSAQYIQLQLYFQMLISKLLSHWKKNFGTYVIYSITYTTSQDEWNVCPPYHGEQG